MSTQALDLLTNSAVPTPLCSLRQQRLAAGPIPSDQPPIWLFHHALRATSLQDTCFGRLAG